MLHTFTVVIPTRNRRDQLVRALVSLRHQDFKDFDVIVVDDRSTEDIASVIPAFPELDLKVLPNQGTGANHARNLGTLQSTARYVAYLDSDDIFQANKLAVVADHIRENDKDIVVSPLWVWRGDARIQVRPSRPPQAGEDISEFYFVADERMQSSSFTIRRELATKVLWDITLPKVQDPDFMIRLVRNGGEIDFITDPLAVLYDNTQTGRISSNNFLKDIRAWLEREDNPLTERARRVFELYAISYDVSHQDKMEALRIILRNRKYSSNKVALKAIVRAFMPVNSFKKLAQTLLKAQNAPAQPQIVSFIDTIEAEAAEIEAGLPAYIPQEGAT